MPSANTKTIWEIGLPLTEAWLALANEKSKERFANAPIFLSTMSELTKPGASVDREKAFERLSEYSAAVASHSDLIETMKEDLLERLFNSELQATGYLENTRPSRAPVFIDPTHFDYCIPNWKLSTIFADGREWSRVRISSRICREKTVARGSGPVIRAAISQLLRDGLDLFAMPRKAAAQEVRKKLGVNSSGGNGLSDVNLAKYIVEACGKKAI